MTPYRPIVRRWYSAPVAHRRDYYGTGLAFRLAWWLLVIVPVACLVLPLQWLVLGLAAAVREIRKIERRWQSCP